MESIELIREFLKDRMAIDPEKVVPEAVLAELGVDSLSMLELIFEFEDRFKIDVPADSEPPKIVGEMVTLMDSLIAASQQS
ncbi:acyl carrier protein [Thauera butanivorans]|uniref:acyl carrier protein n=1 Tax=Thauera butanivorans TaxID=86174 RepID=UPI000837E926|nr:phosphopantetheine-binding protein [Thauera butanivorans]